MTHDELLAKINSAPNADTCWKIAIIRAVVEVHRESYNPNIMDNRSVCQQCTTGLGNIVHYPCLTIRVIEAGLA